MSTKGSESVGREDRLGAMVWRSDLRAQMTRLLQEPYGGEVEDVRILGADASRGRSNAKVFIVVREVDVALYERLTRVTLQIADLSPHHTFNFDIVPRDAVALIPFEALSIRE